MLNKHGNRICTCLLRSLDLLNPRRSFRHSSNLSAIAEELTSRPPNVTYDYLSPTSSHLLNVSLAHFLSFKQDLRYPSISSNPTLLPQGHHIVYFPPPVTHQQLLPDGTDILHSPAAPTPFTRRLWAGGSVTFNPSFQRRLRLDGGRVVCIEGIRDVTIKGKEGKEKIFVHIERRIGYVDAFDTHLHRRLHMSSTLLENGPIQKIWEGDEAAIVEKRNLVFLRKREREYGKDQVEEAHRIIRAPQPPQITTTLNLPPSLLFRFSALTFNAHVIHLNRNYSRDVEGHRNLLVHGPLSLVLMLKLLSSRLADDEMVRELSYKNLVPLYAEEEMVLCLRRDDGLETTNSEGKWDVWIEGKAGGYAVKGSATVGRWDDK